MYNILTVQTKFTGRVRVGEKIKSGVVKLFPYNSNVSLS